jgi:hypothetical protein
VWYGKDARGRKIASHRTVITPGLPVEVVDRYKQLHRPRASFSPGLDKLAATWYSRDERKEPNG